MKSTAKTTNRRQTLWMAGAIAICLMAEPIADAVMRLFM